MIPLTCIIIDDEEIGRINLEIMVKRYCKDFKILGKAGSAKEARGLIDKVNPELIFLDIQMPKEDGFSLLDSIPNPKPLVVFVTAFEEYALRAFKVNALDYLLKPIDPEDLVRVSSKILELKTQKKTNVSFQAQYDQVIQSAHQIYRSRDELERLVLPVSRGYKIVDLSDILRLESSINYSYVFFRDGSSLLICRSLKDFEELLPKNHFCRVHTSHIVNLNAVEQYVSEDGARLVLNDKTIIPVARRRQTHFKLSLKNLNLVI